MTPLPPISKTKHRSTSFYLPEELLGFLAKAAKEQGTSVSLVAEFALRVYQSNYPKWKAKR